jgi:hypothetical protein
LLSPSLVLGGAHRRDASLATYGKEIASSRRLAMEFHFPFYFPKLIYEMNKKEKNQMI